MVKKGLSLSCYVPSELALYHLIHTHLSTTYVPTYMYMYILYSHVYIYLYMYIHNVYTYRFAIRIILPVYIAI